MVSSGVSLPHVSFIAHILLCRVWGLCQQARKLGDGRSIADGAVDSDSSDSDVTRYGEVLKVPEGVYKFLRNALSMPTGCELTSLEPLISDFLLTVGLTIGLRVDPIDLLVVDKRYVFFWASSFPSLT